MAIYKARNAESVADLEFYIQDIYAAINKVWYNKGTKKEQFLDTILQGIVRAEMATNPIAVVAHLETTSDFLKLLITKGAKNQ